MKAEELEIFRMAILRVLDSNRTRFGLGLPAIAVHLVRFGFVTGTFGSEKDFSSAIADELQYLGDKGFVEEALKLVSRENRAWRITAAGIALLDQRG